MIRLKAIRERRGTGRAGENVFVLSFLYAGPTISMVNVKRGDIG